MVLAAYLDRLTRDPGVRDDVIDRVEAADGQVFAVDMGRQTNGTAVEQLTGTLASAVHRYVRRVGAERSREAQVAAIARGVAPWPRIPPGYRRSDDGTLAPDPATRHVVAEAFDMRVGGSTLQAIREHLRANGIDRSYHGVSGLLASRVVLGELHFGDYEPNLAAWPAIVDQDVWQRAQRVRGKSGRKAKSERLLARLGVLRCGSCGARMVVGTANHSAYYIYRCPPNGDCPRRVTIAADAAEDVVVEAARAGLHGIVGRTAVIENVRQARLALERAQHDLDAAIRTLADFANETSAIERLRELQRARDAAQDRLDRIDVPDDAVWLLLDEDWDRLSTTDKRRAISATVERADVKRAERGTPPRERIDVVYHDGIERLTGRTPPLPTNLEGAVPMEPVAEPPRYEPRRSR